MSNNGYIEEWYGKIPSRILIIDDDDDDDDDDANKDDFDKEDNIFEFINNEDDENAVWCFSWLSLLSLSPFLSKCS